MNSWLVGLGWGVLGIVAGACIGMQAPINGQLGRLLGYPVAAAAVSFLAGGVVLWAITFIYASRSGVSLGWGAVPVWMYVAGGLLGMVYVTSSVILTPLIGAAAVMALSVAGQMVAGILLDRIGFMGVAVRELSLGRVAGALLLVAGVVIRTT